MRRITRIIAGVGALAVGMTLLTARPSPAHDGGFVGFVDADGDGISDVAARGHLMKGRIGGPFGLNLMDITLTTDQQTQVDKLKTDHQTAVTALVTALQAKETELRTLKTAATPDQAAITAKIAEINDVRSQIQTADAAYAIAVRGVLTAEQQAALPAQGVGVGSGPGPGRGHGRGGHGRR